MFDTGNWTNVLLQDDLSFPVRATSHHEVSAWRNGIYQTGIRDGSYEPMTLNLFLLGNGLLFLFMLAGPKVNGLLARYATFTACTALQFFVMKNCRSANPTVGFLIGFLSCWNILWSATLLVFNDGKRRSKKVEKHGSKFQWLSLPASFGARFGWALDLVMNSRGIGWDWKVSGTPSRPPTIEAALRGIELSEATKEDKPTSTGRVRYESRGKVLLHYSLQIVTSYMLMDAIKILVNHDPYFWGLVDAPAPAWIESPLVAQIYRRAAAMAFMWSSLRASFAMVPVAFLLLSSGTNAEPWMYPDQFGPFFSSVFSRGLAGFWGGWWHQLFRYSFQTAGRWVTRGLGMKSKSQGGAVLELLISFYLSGFMHAAASITMIGGTSPWRSMFLFFALQPAGIIFELIVSHFLYLGLRGIVPKKILKYTGAVARVLYANAWLYVTLPLLADDLAKGGLFLAEPSPFSPLRALGFGVAGDTAWPWHDAGTYWQWNSDKPWVSGLVM